MKRSLSSASSHDTSLVVAATCFIAATYGLVRLAYGLFLPDVQASLGLTTATAGAVSSAASVAYCVGALCGSAAGRRRRVLVAAALTTAVAGSLGMATASGVASFATAAVVASTSAGLASPALVAVVQHHLDGPRGDRAQGVVNSGTGPGLVAAGVLAAALSPDWRTAFVVSAAVSAAAGLAVLLLDGPRGARARTQGPEARGVLAPRPQRTGPAAWSRLARPAGGALLLGAASAALWTYGRSLLVGAGLGAGWSTAAWIGVGVGGTVTAATAGLDAHLHGARRRARPARRRPVVTDGGAPRVRARGLVLRRSDHSAHQLVRGGAAGVGGRSHRDPVRHPRAGPGRGLDPRRGGRGRSRAPGGLRGRGGRGTGRLHLRLGQLTGRTGPPHRPRGRGGAGPVGQVRPAGGPDRAHDADAGPSASGRRMTAGLIGPRATARRPRSALRRRGHPRRRRARRPPTRPAHPG